MTATGEPGAGAAQQERPWAVGGHPDTGIRAVLFDFGGVLSASPFEAFARYELDEGLEPGFIRSLNAADHHTNAWARLERGEVALEEFALLFESEARAAGAHVDASALLALLGGAPRPAMIEAVRRAREHYLVALGTNNFISSRPTTAGGSAGVLELFDAVFESSRLGTRKPEPAFFDHCCTALGVHPDATVFIDDLGVNLKPARQLGMTTIKFVTEDQALGELEAALRISLR